MNTSMTTTRRTDGRLGGPTTTVLVLGAISFLGPGIWIFAATKHFAETLAPWAPYSAHFLRDAGAFQLGIGVTVLAVLLWRDAVGVVLSGFAAGTLMHALSHGMDEDYTVAVALAVFGLLTVAVLALRIRELRATTPAR